MPDKQFPWGKTLTLVLVVLWMGITLAHIIFHDPASGEVTAYEDGW